MHFFDSWRFVRFVGSAFFFAAVSASSRLRARRFFRRIQTTTPGLMVSPGLGVANVVLVRRDQTFPTNCASNSPRLLTCSSE